MKTEKHYQRHGPMSHPYCVECWKDDHAKENANDRLGATACSPSLDCPHDELVAYIRSMKGGERVREMGGSCMIGKTGTVEIRDNGVCILWDSAEYADGAGVMVTSFTGGARIIQENAPAMASADEKLPPKGSDVYQPTD